MTNKKKVTLIKPVDFAKKVNIRPQMIFSWIRSGSLKVRKMNEQGRGWLVSEEDVERRYQQYLDNADKRLKDAKKYLA